MLVNHVIDMILNNVDTYIATCSSSEEQVQSSGLNNLPSCTDIGSLIKTKYI